MPSEERDLRERIEDSAFLGMRGGVLYGALSYLLVGGLFVVYVGSTQGSDGDGVSPAVVVLGWMLVAVAVVGDIAMLRAIRGLLGVIRRWVDVTIATDPATARHYGVERKLRGSRGRGGPWPGGSFVFGGMFLPPFGTIAAPMTALVLAISLGDPHPAGTRWGLVAGLAAALLCSIPLVLVPLAFTRQGLRLTRWRNGGPPSSRAARRRGGGE